MISAEGVFLLLTSTIVTLTILQMTAHTTTIFIHQVLKLLNITITLAITNTLV